MRTARLLPALTIAAALALAGGAAQAQSNRELNERLERVERRLESSALIELMNSSEQLRRELSTLRGDIEVLRREVQEIKERQRALYVDVDERLRALETAAQAPSGDAGAGAGAGDDAGAGEGTGDTATGGDGTADADNLGAGGSGSDAGADSSGSGAGGDAAAGESEAYQAAFETLRDGRYAQAAEQFRRFLETYPDSRLAANARYWLGESHYVVREFDAALEHFQRVLEDYPESSKRPDAMLKIGFVHFEEERREQARQALQRVVEEYPESTAASLANQRLQRL